MSVAPQYQLIRTPLERPALWLRDQLGIVRRRRNPVAALIHDEERLMGQVLRRALRRDSNCLDIGCHYGSMLSAMLRLAPDGSHVAVEAIPEKVEFLRSKFPEVEIHACAVGAESGQVDFYVNETQSGYSSLQHHGLEGDQVRRIQVECRTLDDLVADHPPFDLIKVDVEGAEELVFRGGAETLRTQRPIVVFECSPSGVAALGTEPVGMYDALADAGMEVFMIRDWLQGGPTTTRDAFIDATTYPFGAFNWVAAPGDR